MDFEIKGSDSWGTDAFQDKFIKDYFENPSLVSASTENEGKKNKGKACKRKKINQNDDKVQYKKKKMNDHGNYTCLNIHSGTELGISERLLSIAKYSKNQKCSQNFNSTNVQPNNTSTLKKKHRQRKKKSKSTEGMTLSTEPFVISETKYGAVKPIRSVKPNEGNAVPHSQNKSNSYNVSNSTKCQQEFKVDEKMKNYVSNRSLKMKTKSYNEIKITLPNNAKNHLKSKNKKLQVTDTSLNHKNCDSVDFSKEKDIGISKQETATESRSSLLRQKAQMNLQAAKFRLLNEKLYTVSGSEAYSYFQDNADDFMNYHHGYQLQVRKWPVNPVDLIIKDLQNKPKTSVIADLGCGDAKIARTFPKQKIYSFDLVALNEHVTCCDMSKVPLADESVDIAVFCLSLMGVNLRDYLRQAFRILKLGGLLKIAEVESRIEDLQEFIKSIEACGFALVNKDVSYKMFVLLDFNKMKKKSKKSSLQVIKLHPCLYKKR